MLRWPPGSTLSVPFQSRHCLRQVLADLPLVDLDRPAKLRCRPVSLRQSFHLCGFSCPPKLLAKEGAFQEIESSNPTSPRRGPRPDQECQETLWHSPVRLRPRTISAAEASARAADVEYRGARSPLCNEAERVVGPKLGEAGGERVRETRKLQGAPAPIRPLLPIEAKKEEQSRFTEARDGSSEVSTVL